MPRLLQPWCALWALATMVVLSAHEAAAVEYRSHAPTRSVIKPPVRMLASGLKHYVDTNRGNDQQDGREATPWKTLRHALRQLAPGDTLYLRGGVYYEHPVLTRSGTAEAPITISAYPGEVVVIDGGLREFYEQPAASWEPYTQGAPGEYVSTRTYYDADDRRVPDQFLPGSWEPLWGIEELRPLALGNFGDSLVPLHGYRTETDLRATNEYWPETKKDYEVGVYCGPGMWFNRQTGRVHIRLAHNTLPGLGDRAYRGETDPRKLPLIVALGFGDDVLRISGIKHVRVRDLTLRGATGSPMIHVYGSEQIELDQLTVYGGFPGLLINASKDIRLQHAAFRGLAAPWTGRAHMKYRGSASYQIVLRNNQPTNENIEIAWSEFTDDHDFAFVRFAKNFQFHHNYVDNFNDDGFECGPKLRNHSMYIYQNRIGNCLGVFTQHEFDKDDSPLDHNPEAGAFIYRNVIDSRHGVVYHLPKSADPTGSFLHAPGALVGDHGSPTWPVIKFYHNTVVRSEAVQRDNFLFGLATNGMRNTERDVFNNILVQLDRVPGANFIAVSKAERLREGGNLLWGVNAAEVAANPFAKFRGSALFQQSQAMYEPGWTTNDRFVNPDFVRLDSNPAATMDLRLQPKSPAIASGLPISQGWPDPLRAQGDNRPDIGALPAGVEPWRVGVNGRMTLWGDVVTSP